MSISHATVDAYWKALQPRLNAFLSSRRNHQVEGFLESVIATFSYVLEDVDQKRTQHQQLARHFDSLPWVALDLLRGVHSAQVFQSLATAALVARTTFEVLVNLKFITSSTTPDLYAKRFANFQMVETLKRHESGRLTLSPEKVAEFRAACADWMDPQKGKLKKQCKWHAEAHTVRDVAERVGELPMYTSLYATNSLFVHGSSIVQNLYRQGQSVQPIAEVKQITRQSLLTADFCLKILDAYTRFFGVPMPEPDYRSLCAELPSLAPTN
jgi:hypothetical protein